MSCGPASFNCLYCTPQLGAEVSGFTKSQPADCSVQAEKQVRGAISVCQYAGVSLIFLTKPIVLLSTGYNQGVTQYMHMLRMVWL